jgi:hypothetical protein
LDKNSTNVLLYKLKEGATMSEISEWAKSLESEIEGIFGKKSNVAAVSEVPVKNNNTNVILGVIVLVLGLAVFSVYRSKTTQQASAWQNNQPSLFQQQPMNGPGLFPQQNVNPHMNVLTTEQKLEVLKKQYENVDLAAQKIWDVTKWTRDRMTLLATVNNHNLVVLQNNHPKTELIYLNSDWTINRLPDRISLDQSDQEFIKKFVK